MSYMLILPERRAHLSGLAAYRLLSYTDYTLNERPET